jgi:hypothetical protein
MRAVFFAQSAKSEIAVAIILGAGVDHWFNTLDNQKLLATQNATIRTRARKY